MHKFVNCYSLGQTMTKKLFFALIIAFSLIFRPVQGFAQSYIFNITTENGFDADVYLNDKLIGKTPFHKKIRFSFKEIPSYELKIKKPGYKDVIHIYTKSSKPAIEKTEYEDDDDYVVLKIKLQKDYQLLDSLNKKIIIGFDKMIFEVKPGTKIGKTKNYNITNSLYWNLDEYTTVGFNNVALDELEKAGFSAAYNEELFAENKRQKSPNFLIGAKLKEINILSEYSTDAKIFKNIETAMQIEWQIFSVRKSKVMAIKTTSGKISLENGTMLQSLLECFKNAFSELLTDSSFNKIISDYKLNIHPEKNQREIILPTPVKVNYKDYSQTINGSLKSVVTVKVDGGHGSGFVISEDGFILTNYHVIEGSKNIDVEFNAGFTIPAEVTSVDEEYDVALIRVKANGFKPLPIKDTDGVNIAEEVTIIGTPKSIELGQSVSKGIISGWRELEEKRYIQTDASVNPGNSGGPMLNMRGEVIGIVSRKRAESEGIGLAIPIHVAIEKLHITFK